MGIIVDDLPYGIMISQIDSDLMADDEQARDSCRRSNRDEEDFSTFWEACTTGKQKETKQVGINGINMIPGRGNGLAMVSERIQPVRHLDEVCGVQGKAGLHSIWSGQFHAHQQEEQSTTDYEPCCGVISAAASPMTRNEMQEALSHHTRDLAASLNQVLTPFLQGQAQLRHPRSDVEKVSSESCQDETSV